MNLPQPKMTHGFALINFIFCSLFCFGDTILFPFMYPRLKLEAKHGDAGSPLMLTPYLKANSISIAQNLSRVHITDKMGFQSHAGFFTVDQTYNSNLYFWYFPAFFCKSDSPVVLWLQGGPGGSSLFGLFTELGPLIAKKEGFARRKYHWALNNHLIFIDNPVGTGFSFTKNERGYCNNEVCIAKCLYNALQQFLTLFPQLRANEFYITGESYAGKYIPSLAMEIHEQNGLKGTEKINLKGLAIGNGYCDPVNQLDYGTYLYQLGLIDDVQLEEFGELQAKIISQIREKDWAEANMLMDRLMDGEMNNSSLFKNYTGFNYYYNYMVTEEDEDMTMFSTLLENDNVRHSIHVGGLPFHSGEKVQIHLMYDVLQSVAHLISKLLSHYRILFYNGQLDIVVAYPLTVNFLKNLDFDGAETYKSAPRKIWMVNNDIAGYVKKAKNLTEVLVRNAGHMVPHDQPRWAFDMITKFVKNKL